MELGGEQAARRRQRRDDVRRLAVADVRSGMSLVGAAALWGVDTATLTSWIASESGRTDQELS
ncbi:hypothetical protein ACU61A_15650 [Pseudonocardia sichuanensis]